MENILTQFNSTKVEYPLDQCLHKFIESQVERQPNSRALTFQGKTITYESLNSKANQLAHFLQKKNIVPETLVGICAYRSLEMVIGLLAIIKAGGAYVPLDPVLPSKRLEFVIQDSNVPIILAHKSCGPMLSETSAGVAFFEDIEAELANYPSSNPDSEVTPDNLAYVIYTSGSTGNPKGAMNTHRAIVNRLFWMQDTFKINENDTLIQKTPFSFDVSVWEFFWPFMFGARLVVAKPEGHKDPEYLQNLIHTEGVTIIHFVPSMLHMFLDVAEKKSCESLKHVILSGEAVTMELQKRFFSKIDTRLHNLYGPTEAAVDVSYWECDPNSQYKIVPIGKPISNTKLYILDKELKPVPFGDSGELHIGGVQVARGYLNRPELSAEKFIPDPFSEERGATLYKTGDLCRYLQDGNIEYLGRIDFQVKIRGNRIELGEIESVIENDPWVKQCVVTVREDLPGEKRLIAYVVEEEAGRFSITDIRRRLVDELPDYMIPSAFVQMPELPLTPSGKTDRRALPKPGRERPKLASPYVAPGTLTEKKLVHVWQDILNLDKVGVDDNFFELGGDSLLSLKVVAKLQSDHKINIPVVKMFEFPSIAGLAHFLDSKRDGAGFMDEAYERATRQRIGRFHDDLMLDGVAIIGMAGRFPGAASIDELWANLCNDVESITFFSRDEVGPGIDPDLLNDPDYILARGFIEDADMFDASFFGIGPLEAKVMDPQHRVFMELSWAALENAGYDSESFPGMIGVYAGVGDNHYYPNNVLSHPDLVKTVGNFIIGYGNEKDYIATRASFALNLTGPSVSSNTGCSTTLLAVDQAFRALLDYECDIALAGGVDIYVPQKSGFLFQENGVFSKDGHCRPFDSKATGTLFNDGAGVVVLKRLSDALTNGDRIYAIIRGAAKNNDGANKVSFLAPSVVGQAKVISLAQAQANVKPEDISYIEAHGTGTPLGDPIEIEALTEVFRAQTKKKQFCLIGCIKGHIGHPTIASGVAGLIKAALCLYNEQIPATLHFKEPNPRIDFENSPFKVVNKLTPWPRSTTRRIAGVSSFGFGGTNVHVILEEAPQKTPSSPSRPKQLLLMSTKSEGSLKKCAENLRKFFQQNDDVVLADAAFTLIKGRRSFAHRQFVVCEDIFDVIGLLEKPDPLRCQSRVCEERDPQIVFMFPGQGTQYVNMGKNLYDHEPLFRETVDKCCEIIQPHLGCDLRDFLYPAPEEVDKASESLKNTYYTQPALFIIEYSLSRLLMHWGIKPSATIGHSIGEFVGACLSGIFSLDDALKLVAIRGRLINERPPGSMLSVRRGASEIEKLMPENIDLAASNSPNLCVVSGSHEAVSAFEEILGTENIPCKRLHTSHAFHSVMMEPVVEIFTREVSSVNLNPPQIPLVSTAKGEWMSDEDAVNPSYWGRHLRTAVRFSDGVEELLKKESVVLLEVGPRTTLATLTRQHFSANKRIPVTSSLNDTHIDGAEWTALLSSLGFLWLHGVTLDWDAFYSNERRSRIPLPTYPFERKRFWLDPQPRFGKAESLGGPYESFEAEEKGDVQEQLSPKSSEEALELHLVKSIVETTGMSLEGIDPAVTFLELGMDSLLLSQLAQKIKSDFGVKVTFSHLMRQYSNIKLLSDYIRESTTEGEKITAQPDEAPVISGAPIQEKPSTVSVTLPQRGLWISSKFNEALSCAYNESITVKLTGDVQLPLVETALHSLVEKHDALRAIFSEDGTQMTIRQEAVFGLQRINLDGLGGQEAEKEFLAILRKDAVTPFDLSNGPLLRCLVVSMPDNQVNTVFTSHHIVCDGWSLDVLISDFCIFYDKLQRQETIDVVSSYTYADFVQLVTGRTGSTEYNNARAYWLDKFKSFYPVLQLPLDKTRSQTGSHRARRIDLDIKGDIVPKLREQCRKRGWSMFSAFVAAYNILLYRISGQEDFVLGLPTAEQPLIGQEDLVGHCVNLVPLWSPVDTVMSYDECVSKVQQLLFEAYDHQIFTFVDLLDEKEISFDRIGVSPLPAGLTNVKKYLPGQLQVAGAEVEYFANPRAFESFELYLNVVESPEELELKCHYKTDRFKKETVTQWLHIYKQILEAIALDPEATLEPPLYTEKESRREFVHQYVPVSEDDRLVENLLPIWRNVFGKLSIGPDENFFELGGHSLLAARLFAQIERELGISVPISALYAAPTAASLAGFIQNKPRSYDWKYLVPINPEGTRPPIFLVHGAEGNILLYRDLARYLGKDQPVYGIQSAGLDGKTDIDAGIENVAANYVKEIQQGFPEGPYLLGGYCLGGTIALEMAQQIIDGGNEVALLFMIENFNVKTVEWPQPFQLVMANKFLNFRYHLENLFTSANTQKAAFFKKKAQTEISRYKISVQVALSSLMKTMGFKNSLDFPHVKIDRLYDHALTIYNPRLFKGKIILFGAEKRLAGLTDKLYGWEKIALGGIELHELPCRPRGCLIEPYVRVLADKLKETVGNVTNTPCMQKTGPCCSSVQQMHDPVLSAELKQ